VRSFEFTFGVVAQEGELKGPFLLLSSLEYLLVVLLFLEEVGYVFAFVFSGFLVVMTPFSYFWFYAVLVDFDFESLS